MKPPTLLLLLVVALLAVSTNAKKNKGRKSGRMTNKQSEHRARIVKCCGWYSSCNQPVSMRKRPDSTKETNATIRWSAKYTSSAINDKTVSTEASTAEETGDADSSTSAPETEPPTSDTAASNADPETTAGPASAETETTTAAATTESTTANTATSETTTPTSTSTSTSTTTSTTSTTTTPDPTTAGIILTGMYCVPRDCPPHGCSVDPVLQNSMLAGNDTADGKFYRRCSQKYLVSSVKKTRIEAAKTCCKYNMRLLSIETDDEQMCITSLNNAMTEPYCPSQWCPNVNYNATPVISAINRLMNAPLKINDKCSSYVLTAGDDTKSGIKFHDCNSQFYFICESFEAACPTACTKDTSLFSSRGHLIDAQSYGHWINNCNFTYLIGTSLGTWDSNYEFCCQIGMAPFVLDRAEEVQCFEGLLKGWPYNFNYWTDGSRVDQPTAPKWCSLQKSISQSNITLVGVRNSSYEGNDCVAMQINKVTTNITSYFSSMMAMRNCTSRQMLACRASLFEGGGKLKYATNYGRWFGQCERYFVFTETYLNLTATWQEAKCKCEAIGMKLANAETLASLKCLDDLTNEQSSIQGSYWSSGAYLDCDDEYNWCSLGDFFNATTVKWGSQQPPTNKNNTCVQLVLGAEGVDSYLTATNCDEKANYICEMEDTNGESLTKARNEMCQKAFNVTDADLDTVFTKPEPSFNMKKMGLLKGTGVLKPENILKLVEASTKNNDALQENFNIFDVCKNKKPGGCETIAQSFQCTVQSAPSVVSGMVNDNVKDISSGAPISCTNVDCGTAPACTINTADVNLLAAGQGASGDNYGSVYGYPLTACGKRYYVSSLYFDYTTVATKCCQLNMTLAYFNTLDDLKCFIAADEALLKTKAGVNYFMGGNNQGCISFFGWCPSKRAIPALKFVSQSTFNAQTHRILTLRAESTKFLDSVAEAMPTETLQYICIQK